MYVSVHCEDLSTYCAWFGEQGYCTEEYVEWMTTNCNQTCNFCETESKFFKLLLSTD